MSREAVSAFLLKAEGDAGLRAELESALAREQGAVAGFLATAERHGFEFTAQEFVDAVRSLRGTEQTDELSDADLRQVAGGLSPLILVASGLLARFKQGPGAFQIGRPGGLQMEEEEELLGPA